MGLDRLLARPAEHGLGTGEKGVPSRSWTAGPEDGVVAARGEAAAVHDETVEAVRRFRGRVRSPGRQVDLLAQLDLVDHLLPGPGPLVERLSI